MTSTPNRWRTTLAGLAIAAALAACGGGGGSTTAPTAVTPAPIVIPPAATPAPEAGAPASVGNIAIDGRNWINFRRSQVGVPLMTQNALIDRAAQAHSDYQKLLPNKPSGQPADPTHTEEIGKAGFTGVDLLQRLSTAGYDFNVYNSYAYGEVISATTSNSGAYMVDELITAIYHRFVIFEPMFKEIGAGSATVVNGYTYFTSDFTSNNGYGPGIGRGVVVTWPYSGQSGVRPNFFSDYELPDPVPGKDSNGNSINEVGYPVSVHADISATLTVDSFTIRPRGGAVLSVKLLQHVIDAAATPPVIDKETPASAAAIVPLAPLRAATTYDVTFSGIVDGLAVSKSWSFTTK